MVSTLQGKCTLEKSPGHKVRITKSKINSDSNSFFGKGNLDSDKVTSETAVNHLIDNSSSNVIPVVSNKFSSKDTNFTTEGYDSIYVNLGSHFNFNEESDQSLETTIDIHLSTPIDLNKINDKQYREDLVLKFRNKARKLARSILRKWHARLDLQEVDSLVDLSLCEAVKRYDSTRGASFMTFLFFHLRGNLIRAVSGAANAHVIPGVTDVEENESKQIDTSNVDSKEDSDLKNINKLSATASEVAEALCSHEVCAPDELLLKKELASISAVACKKLDPLEREVIQRIYLQEQQLLDIADSLGYSRCHISRVKKKALATLYDELRITVADIYVSAKPNFDEDDDSSKKKSVRRRRPRSQKSVQALIDLSAA